ncbi:MAG TPA: hypothetical protein PK442_10630, partial [Synergistales bacterium]|nr:hypothetical protein [Synergistales bacterium]
DNDPVIVVVSTDSNEPSEWSAAAFIATVRIAQQFRPVHVWWQGAWLDDHGRERGYVFHAPLVTNDMDYSRLDYVLADDTRDNLSFGVLYSIAKIGDKVGRLQGMGRRADRAYMSGAKFVDHNGIRPKPEQIASHACRWLGMATPWAMEYATDQMAESALQEIPDRTPYVDTRTEREKARERREFREWDRRQERQTAERARERRSKAEI